MNDYFIPRLKKIEAVLRENLPDMPYSAQWIELSFGATDPAVQPAHIKNLTDPCKNLIASGGKRWRPLLAVLCAEASCADKTAAEKDSLIEQAYALTPLIEFVHTASLIHDDIEDAADMRRGKPAAHIRYGTDSALNAGSWLYFEAAACLRACSPALKTVLYDILMTELRRLHLGQAMDIAWHKDNQKLPSIEEYLAMTALKTGTLSSLAARCGVLAGGGSAEQAQTAAEYAAAIGVGFQIRDDIINLTTGNAGKKRGDDIVEGKKSLPVLYHLQKNPGDFKTLAAYFAQAAAEGIHSPAVENAISVLTSGDALQKAQEKSSQLIETSCAGFQNLFPHTEAAAVIGTLFSAL